MNIAPAQAARKNYPRPPLHFETDSTRLLLRWLTRHALVSEAHASVVAELAFRSRRAG